MDATLAKGIIENLHRMIRGDLIKIYECNQCKPYHSEFVNRGISRFLLDELTPFLVVQLQRTQTSRISKPTKTHTSYLFPDNDPIDLSPFLK